MSASPHARERLAKEEAYAAYGNVVKMLPDKAHCASKGEKEQRSRDHTAYV